jgi:ElaB/YqjD/DUF883 family membrane-anchored ribosome-binding protein
MERNQDEIFDRGAGARGGDAGFGSSGSGAQGGTGYGSTGASESFGSTGGTGSDQSLSSQAHGAVDTLKEKASSAGSNVKEKATQLKSTLADKLEAGADKLRQRAGTTNSATTTDGSLATDASTQGTARMAQVGDKVATGMESTADWLRTADMQSIQTGLEEQVRTNPGKSLLIALGVGYALGRLLGGGKSQSSM